MTRGSCKAWSNRDRDIMILKYSDKKNVHVLTTAHPHNMVVAKGKEKPLAVVRYNESMGGVDKSDQVKFHPLNIRWLYS